MKECISSHFVSVGLSVWQRYCAIYMLARNAGSNFNLTAAHFVVVLWEKFSPARCCGLTTGAVEARLAA